jgi:xylulose-5-phosphate/fructose-6-phosphate phosphoketolase
VHIVDSMVNQHAKWLKSCNAISGVDRCDVMRCVLCVTVSRTQIPSLNILLTSHVWRQEHNGNSHEDAGFIDHVCNKKSNVVRVYLPPDANSLLVVTNHILSIYNRINVIFAGKQPSPQWLDMPSAIANFELGINIWRWASNDASGKADVCGACAQVVRHSRTHTGRDGMRWRRADARVPGGDESAAQLLPAAARAMRQRDRPHGDATPE